MKRAIAAVLIATVFAGCATHVPVIDTKGVDMNAYQTDLAECQQIAKQVDPAATAGAGVAAGAIFGALLGAAIGGRGMAGYGAKIGAVDGLAVGAGGGAMKQVNIVNRCMAGRGYKVLG